MTGRTRSAPGAPSPGAPVHPLASQRIVLPAFLVCAGIVLGAAVGRSPGIGIGLLVVGLATVLGLQLPQALLYLAVVSGLTVEGLVKAAVVPGAASVLVDLVLVLAVAAAIGKNARGASADKRITLGALLLAFLVLSVVSAIANGVPLLGVILGVRTYAKYVLLYLAVVMGAHSTRTLDGLVWLLIALAVLQVPASLIQFASGGSQDADLVTGTLGVGMSGVQTVWLLTIVGLMYRIRAADRARGWLGGLIPLALFVPIILNETRVAFFVAPLVLLWLGVSSASFKNAARVLRIILVFTLAMAGVYFGYQALYGEPIAGRYSVEDYLGRRYAAGVEGRMRRIPLAAYALETAASSPRAMLIGHGPGSASKRSVAGISGSLFAANPTAHVDDTFFARLTLEYGVAGWVVFGALAAYAASLSRRGRQVGVPPRRLAVVDATAFLGLIQMPLSLYTSVWTADALALSFWLLIGVSEGYLRQSDLAQGADADTESAKAVSREAAA